MKQAIKQNSMETTASTEHATEEQRLMDKKVKDLTVDESRLVEVPYTASLAHTMNALVANQVVAVPVAAPPGHWIGAGGSMIMESDKQTGIVRKHYIGMVTMFNILAHIAGDDRGSDLERKMLVPVSSIIGHCLEGLSLWTLNPNTSILDCMEVFSKGIHRALVPGDIHMENISGIELVESSSSYQMLTQMDLLRFIKGVHASELEDIILCSVKELGPVNEKVFAITDRRKVIEAIKCMKTDMLNAVPIVQAADATEEDQKQLINGKGRKLIGTLSATDLRGCHLAALRTWLPLSALDFTEKVSTSPLFTAAASDKGTRPRELVTCHGDSPLAEVIDKAVTKHVHRIWAVGQQDLLVGVVSLTDIMRALRAALLSKPAQYDKENDSVVEVFSKICPFEMQNFLLKPENLLQLSRSFSV